MNLAIRLLKPCDLRQLESVAEGVFDQAVSKDWALEFLSDPRHHIAAAVDEDLIVGFASAVHYVHPDKRPELWINEVGVAPSHRNRGIGRQVVQLMLAHGRTLGCARAWVLTDSSNLPAMRLYGGLPGNKAPCNSVMFEFNLTQTDQVAT